MTFKRLLSLLCVLTLVLTLVSGFAFATSQEAGAEVDEAGNNTRSASYCYAKRTTSIYEDARGIDVSATVHAGDMMQILTGHTTYMLHVRTTTGVDGYVLRADVIMPG